MLQGLTLAQLLEKLGTCHGRYASLKITKIQDQLFKSEARAIQLFPTCESTLIWSAQSVVEIPVKPEETRILSILLL